MNKGMIITLPRNDYVTEYISQFSSEIIDEADKKGINVKKLKDKQANRREFETVVKKLNYKLIILNGHGSDKSIEGQNEVLVECKINDSILRERITYARSCNAGKVLGKSCMKNNKKGCFLGYELPFMFYIDENWISTPKRDKIAPLFLEPSNLVPISLIKGNSAFHAHENSKKQLLKNINKVLRNGSKESFLFAEALWNNYTGQVLIGNDSASL